MFEVASTSLLGNRKMNQDRCSVLSDEHSTLLLLADGLGGHPKGEAAAQILMDTGKIAFASNPKPIVNPHKFLNRILHSAHDSVLAFGRKFSPPINPRATAVIALIQNQQLFWRHLGDSRLYLFRNQQIIMRTRDHSVIEAMRIMGKSVEGKNATRYRNMVTHCLGGTGKKLSSHNNVPVALSPKDMLLMCTDGLWNLLTDEAMSARMLPQVPLEPLVADLAREAEQSAAPHSDNITLIALRWLSVQSQPNGLPQVLQDGKQQPTAEPTTASDYHHHEIDAPDPELEDAIVTLRAIVNTFPNL